MKNLASAMGVLGLMVLGFSSKTNAQSFQNKDNIITFGFGFDPYFQGKFKSGWGPGYKYSAIGPIVLTYERGITDKVGIGYFGVGGGIAQSFHTTKWYTNQNYEHINRNTRTAIFVRCAYHFDLGIEKLDVYAGVGGGVNIDNRTYRSDDPFDFNPKYKDEVNINGGPDIFGGVRYYFTNSFGVYGEVGYGSTTISGGLAFKF